jgi:catechol 2,3-dioxygenase-like lactoylglutathione lyase family enzyme
MRLNRPGVRGLNHLTLAVTELGRSISFYVDVLGLNLRAGWGEGAYLDAGDLWLCLSVDAAAANGPNADYTHYAFDVAAEDFNALFDRVRKAGASEWRRNKSEGASLYICDPDGHRLELHVGDLASRLARYRLETPDGVKLFD